MITESKLISRRQALQWAAAAAGLAAVVVSHSLPAHSQDPGQESLVSKTTGVDYAELDQALRNRNWKEADQLTRDLMLQVADRIEEGWLDEDSIRQFPGEDLKLIDRLWVEHSNGTLGFSVQKRIWQECGSPGSNYDDNESA